MKYSITIFMFTILSVVSISASNIADATVTQGQYVYTPVYSYTGDNTASATGNKAGTGYVEQQEVINNSFNKSSCKITGSLNGTLSCEGSIGSKNKADARAMYTNLTGSASLSVSLKD